jgi:hypothetical protein
MFNFITAIGGRMLKRKMSNKAADEEDIWFWCWYQENKSNWWRRQCDVTISVSLSRVSAVQEKSVRAKEDQLYVACRTLVVTEIWCDAEWKITSLVYMSEQTLAPHRLGVLSFYICLLALKSKGHTVAHCSSEVVSQGSSVVRFLLLSSFVACVWNTVLGHLCSESAAFTLSVGKLNKEVLWHKARSPGRTLLHCIVSVSVVWMLYSGIL